MSSLLNTWDPLVKNEGIDNYISQIIESVDWMSVSIDDELQTTSEKIALGSNWDKVYYEKGRYDYFDLGYIEYSSAPGECYLPPFPKLQNLPNKTKHKLIYESIGQLIPTKQIKKKYKKTNNGKATSYMQLIKFALQMMSKEIEILTRSEINPFRLRQLEKTYVWVISVIDI